LGAGNAALAGLESFEKELTMLTVVRTFTARAETGLT